MKKILFYVLFFLVVITRVPADMTSKYDDVSSPEHVMLSFENAINTKDFQRAWNYWKLKPGPDFEKWKKGYSDTKHIDLYYKYKDSDAGAGNRWVTYNVKIFSEDTKGKKHLYEGYYTLHTSAPELYEEGKWPGWRIEKGEFKKIY
ncbi:Uncharacterised protein [Sebaldella termitidis]|uniref:Uncharacterized protein n=1 Tax=Sebaldella termitidis (strain ATCC 33386 / NCTC 11300) TaxID=526218 RepID=D1ANM7_SEBTE|nr:hypothetical protein [Sebaldella termitidis]ACZ09831.1 conserved hypothetical protein [Sebaldella termitidis ATCC 33386]SUI25162.1 Uncharacterised protein [Sebaldella termitidis]